MQIFADTSMFEGGSFFVRLPGKSQETKTMADYVSSQHVARMLEIPEGVIAEIQERGLLQLTVKDGRTFLSSQQVYRLRAALQWSHLQKIPLAEAFAKVEERWLAHSSALKG